MQCVTTVTYNIPVNGTPTEKFKPNCGIRQGDPLSPYIFIICTNILSCMLQKLEDSGTLKGVAINKGGLPISHLMFADDVIIFFKVANQNTDKLSQTLQSFCELSGQKINGTKSVMMVSPNCDETIKEDLTRKLKVNIAEKIGKYLGIPVNPGTPKREIGNQIIYRLQSRLQTCSQ